MQNADDMEFVSEAEYPDELKKEFLAIIEKSGAGKALSYREISMLFFWTRHMNEPRFDFAEKYRHPRKAAKKASSKDHPKSKAKKEKAK